MDINLREIFSKQSFVRALNTLEPISTVVIDELYIKRTKNIPSPVISMADLHTDIRAVGVTLRGGKYVDLSGGVSLDAKWIEPYPIRLKERLDAVELNNLKMIDSTGIESWKQQKIEKLRNTNRATTELMAVQSLKGKIDMVIVTDDGSEAKYTVDYGSIQTHTVKKAFNATDATLSDIFDDLLEMQSKVKKAGCGGIEFWAGKSVWFAIYSLISAMPNDARVPAKVDGTTIITPAGNIKLRNEEVYDPAKKEFSPIIPDTEIMCIAKDAPHSMPYAAIDDLDAKLQALPFFVKPVHNDEEGWRLLSESKPLPAPVTKAICWASGAIQ